MEYLARPGTRQCIYFKGVWGSARNVFKRDAFSFHRLGGEAEKNGRRDGEREGRGGGRATRSHAFRPDVLKRWRRSAGETAVRLRDEPRRKTPSENNNAGVCRKLERRRGAVLVLRKTRNGRSTSFGATLRSLALNA